MGIVGAETKSKNKPEGGQSVAPVNFFAFLVGAAIVAHWNFINAEAIAGDLGGNLGLNAKAVRDDRNGSKAIGCEGLVAGLHVGEVEVVKHVGEEGEKPVPGRVPEIKHLPLFTKKTRAENDVCSAIENGPEQALKVRGIIFEIGVLKDGEVTAHLGNRTAKRSAFALILFLPENFDLRVGNSQFQSDAPGVIGRAVIHQHNLAVQAGGQTDGKNAFDAAAQRELFVERGDQNRKSAEARLIRSHRANSELTACQRASL